MLEADALVLHLNPLQEALQPEGDTNFGGLLARIAELCARLERPVIVKEVGWGLSPEVVRSLFQAGVAAVDVAGAGGTSWSEVERHRLGEPWRQRVAAAFAGWGIPTAEALVGARRAAPGQLVFASGGMRDGVEVAKAVALGADLVGLAGPFLRAAAQGSGSAEAALELGRELIATLKIAMFCVGARGLAELRRTPRLVRQVTECA
jgi:isopentenyl-diphosphate delta-isomerase